MMRKCIMVKVGGAKKVKKNENRGKSRTIHNWCRGMDASALKGIYVYDTLCKLSAIVIADVDDFSWSCRELIWKFSPL